MLSKLAAIISSNLNNLCLITSTLTSLFTYLYNSRKISFSYILNRHDSLIFPLFECLDPYLYYKVDKDNIDENDIRNAIQLIDNNKNCAGGKLIAFSYYLRQDFSEPEKLKYFCKLCSYVDLHYDLYCIRLHLSRRPYTYRKYRSHGHSLNTFRFIFWLIKYFLIIVLFLLGLLSLSRLVQNSIDSSSFGIGSIVFYPLLLVYSILGTCVIIWYGKE